MPTTGETPENDKTRVDPEPRANEYLRDLFKLVPEEILLDTGVVSARPN